ncbi:LacI family DNA-binding transcriptional regulator [Leuconostoc kimchii]|uniref:LacI family transcriptional regulator n=1 Tax=Leuconostoc kimchii TaxID=136609 RepID=A0ABX5SJJ1_9LACO|nr:LacI family DNA-binding transcriptional regulator [Leuconostoc kimchii]QBR47506.1 LacI family transcriptional regulator [Leuconostoc kimchii]
MVTIQQIAEETGLSSSTVSRILNNDQTLSVRDTTRQLVFEVATKHHYTKKIKKNIKIGVITTFSEMRENHDAYWRQIYLGIQSEARQHNITIDEIMRLDKKTRLSQFRQFDALIALGELSSNAVQEIKAANQRLVLVDAKKHYQNVDAVDPELTNMTIRILDELYQSGRHHIGFIGGINDLIEMDGSTSTSERDLRYVAYKQWTSQHQLNEYVYEGSWQAETGNLGAKHLLTEQPQIDALLIASDPIAIGALNKIKTSGLEPGKDIDVVSFDDLDLVKYLVPALTSVDLKATEMGKTALNRAVELVTEIDSWTVWSTIPSALEYRETFMKFTQ